MALHVFVFVFLLVVCFLLSLARLGRLDWFPLRSSSLRGRAKCSTLHRLLKPRTPDDCSACRLASTASSAAGPAPAPVRPWREVKSRRGAPKRIHTEGFACPNRQCMYFGITEAHIHAAFWRWHAWPSRAHPDLSLPGLPYYVQCSTPHAPISSENPLSTGRHGALCPRRGAGPFRRRAGLRLPSGHDHHLAVAGSPCMRRPCTSVSFGPCISPISSWMNCGHGYAALNRCCGTGWPSTFSRRFFRCLSSAPEHNTWHISTSILFDSSSLLAACRFSPVMA